jgi:hypothetical protein
MSVPVADWQWFGHAGHFIAADSCMFRLHTRIGDKRISTIGDYYPAGHEGAQPQEIGWGRTHETFVFEVDGPGEGVVRTWSEIDTDAYMSCEAATAGHLAMCQKYAEIVG